LSWSELIKRRLNGERPAAIRSGKGPRYSEAIENVENGWETALEIGRCTRLPIRRLLGNFPQETTDGDTGG
jgi:hypothetical protein